MKFCTRCLMLILLLRIGGAIAQPLQRQQGMVLKNGTNIRLGGINILNRHNSARCQSISTGVFSIAASRGDTLQFTGDNYVETRMVVTDLSDKIVFLSPVIALNEVFIKETSLKTDIKEVQLGYRRKSVFYTGPPHYYYLLLKPMTFIYENFKSEVKEARRFNRYARREITSAKIAERFNNIIIKNAVPIRDFELEDFKDIYTPTIQQLGVWSDYDMINYIRRSYANFQLSQPSSKN